MVRTDPDGLRHRHDRALLACIARSDSVLRSMTQAFFAVTAFGAGLAVLLGAGFLFVPRREPLHVLLAALFAAFALALIPSLLHQADRLTWSVPRLTAVAGQFCVGPLFYFYGLLWSGRRRELRPRDLLHFLPILAPIFLAFADPTMQADGPHSIAGHIAAVHVAAYLTLTAVTLTLAWHEEHVPSARRVLGIAAIFAGAYTAIAWITVGGIFQTGHTLAHAAVSVGAGIIAVHYLVSQRHPLFTTWAVERLQRRQGDRNPLGGFDLDKLQHRLEELMEHDRPYLDEDLSLPGLAHELQLTPHQLSRFLNEVIGESFYNFVNRYRIMEAQRLLREDSERTVLSVAYAVGFNAKSSFHTAFAKFTGETPGAYRAKQSQS